MSGFPYSPSHLPDSDSISIESHSSVSTNATAPNLVGPGRTVGLVYDKIGGWVERKMNWLATRQGHGPHKTAEAIEKVLEGAEVWRLEGEIRYRPLTDDEKSVAKKKCRVLLKYTR